MKMPLRFAEFFLVKRTTSESSVTSRPTRSFIPVLYPACICQYAWNMNSDRSEDWFRQAEDDRGWASDTFNSERWAQVCYIAQQTGEKALKALALRRGAERVRTHSIADIARELGINGEIERAGRRLDQYYMTTRYPDALPSGAPFEYFDREQASEALAYADLILASVKKLWNP